VPNAAVELFNLDNLGPSPRTLRDGRFDQEAMLAFIQQVLISARAEGFPLTRLLAHMEWALEDRPGVNDLIEYEGRLNYILPRYHDPIVCVYDSSKFDAGVVMDMLRTHPVVLVGGALEQNPFFVAPDEFLKELHHRGTSEGFGKGLAEENRQLRQTIRDLVALSGMPAAWMGREPEKIAEGIVGTLMSALRLEAVQVLLNRPAAFPVQVSRTDGWPEFVSWSETEAAQARNADDGMAVQRAEEIRTKHGSLYAVVVPIGVNGEAGWITAAAQHPGFPTDMEMLLLLVTANQALISFEGARVINERKRAEEAIVVLRDEIHRTSQLQDLIGSSPAFQEVLERIEKVAPTESTVLITGETGTGKELVARAIHGRSPRADRPFLTVNCAALSPHLIAAELFGHEKGAFTGAQQRRLGRFELADGGTIFLDEIGDVPPETQIALLRVLQERIFERVGGTEPIFVDVRVISATNRKLKAAVDAGQFRADLYYRLNVFPIEVPPLRERKEDIPVLVRYFVGIFSQKLGKKIERVDQKTLERLQSYDWPGNIRELQNVIERSVILSEGDTLSVDQRWLTAETRRQRVGPLIEKLRAEEREIVEAALAQSKGRIAGHSGAAARLGIPASTLESRIRSLKIDKNRFRPQ
jgi:transcriptional regulator with GAF, ATPase, and Fis domain